MPTTELRPRSLSSLASTSLASTSLASSLRLAFAAALTFTAWGVPVASANNGAISYAYPIDGVSIDGDLTDWGEEHTRYPITWTGDDTELASDDFAASFRIAYNLADQSLYVVLEAEDDVHVRRPDGEPDWTAQDSHLLYIDREHRPHGSGVVLYQFGEGFRELSVPLEEWDPASAGASWDSVTVATRRRGTRTVYEWRIALGGDLRPNRSLGIDHLVADRDSADELAILLWGGGFGKSQNSYRLGDVVLLAAGAKLGRLEGSVSWAATSDEPLPSHVRITSVAHPDLWLQASVDEEGRYSAKLPEGEYRIDCPFALTKPFSEGFGNLPLRIDRSTQLQVRVIGERTAAAEPLVLRTYARPDYLFAERPVLLELDADRELELDTFIEAFRRYYDVPGVSVALVHDGKLAYHRAFGVKNTLTGQPVASSTLFEAASITKPVFAYAVQRLAQRGLIDLDRPLHEYLPFDNIAADERSRRLTARLVLSHRSGLPNWAWGGPGGWRDGGELELDFAPGERFGYSGEAFNYLGRAVEAITGKDLTTVLTEEVSRPIGLRNTFYALDEQQARVASIGHNHFYPVWKPRAAEVSPASSMHTEAADFSRFMIELIERRHLSAESYAEMWKTQTEIPPEDRVYADDWEQSVGLGFFLRETPFGQLVEHGGNNGDFDCKFGVVPEAGVGYAIFTNGNVGDELTRALEILLLRGRM